MKAGNFELDLEPIKKEINKKFIFTCRGDMNNADYKFSRIEWSAEKGLDEYTYMLLSFMKHYGSSNYTGCYGTRFGYHLFQNDEFKNLYGWLLETGLNICSYYLYEDIFDICGLFNFKLKLDHKYGQDEDSTACHTISDFKLIYSENGMEYEINLNKINWSDPEIQKKFFIKTIQTVYKDLDECNKCKDENKINIIKNKFYN